MPPPLPMDWLLLIKQFIRVSGSLPGAPPSEYIAPPSLLDSLPKNSTLWALYRWVVCNPPPLLLDWLFMILLFLNYRNM